jgi:CubicO group peptidase (beta-lactamase class C family)
LNMKDSGYDSHSAIQKDRAAGYVLGRDGLVNADYIDMSIPHGAGALYSTVEDLYRWDRALYTEKLAKNDSLKKIFTPFKDNYGYGWLIYKKFKRECVGHGGGIEGFKANISRYPESNTCIIVLSNFEHAPVSDISQNLAAILFGERYEFTEKSLGSKTILLSYCPLFISNLHFILAGLFLCGENGIFISCGSSN